MDAKYDWIYELANAERLIEETGVVDFGADFDPERQMIGSALTFLNELRTYLSEMIETYNNLKKDKQNQIKIYAIAKTPADFMLFRNGLKLAFTLKQPGLISIRAHSMTNNLPSYSTGLNHSYHFTTETMLSNSNRNAEDVLEFVWGPFNEALWMYKGQPIKVEAVARFYFTKFIRETIRPGS